MVGDCPLYVEGHVTLMTETSERSKSNSHRLDNTEKLIDTIHEMNTNVLLIAQEIKHQGETMEQIAEAQKNTQIEVDDIKEKMETKDTVSRLHERVDDLEKVNGKLAIKAWAFIGGLVVSGALGFLFAQLLTLL